MYLPLLLILKYGTYCCKAFFFLLLLFFLLLGFCVVLPTKSRIYISSLNSQHSLQSFKFDVGWTLGGHTFPDTTVWVNANIHAGKKFYFSVEIFQMLERCVFYIVDDCQPFHLLLCVGFTELKISAVGRLQNGHILISYSFCTLLCTFQSLYCLWLWHQVWSVLDASLNCYF